MVSNKLNDIFFSLVNMNTEYYKITWSSQLARDDNLGCYLPGEVDELNGIYKDLIEKL